MEKKLGVLKIQLHGNLPNTTPRVIEAPFTDEFFESVPEAIEVLGEAKLLTLLNYAHNLDRRAIQRAAMLKRNSEGIGTPRKPRASKGLAVTEASWKMEVKSALESLVKDGLVEYFPETGTLKLK